ncbi:hypothetical protein KY290_003613 [Solanum tuberosum]|uniref:Uncharacterized protein n=1 Tax=Solanum tuberosum TaxID=4113 RepID=A0ABQ7WTF3_SOLTU|nr:hypothetical protein KY284_003766 [Solanum tuberosum]KAH0767738.1 hypothetical protein KY285_003609 [Solanum tuberosum]KAH0784015.1 hypothetical protein KY290_003613 [Solanum tuberosum]
MTHRHGKDSGIGLGMYVGKTVQLYNYEIVGSKRIQGAWVLAKQLGCARLTCGQSYRQNKATSVRHMSNATANVTADVTAVTALCRKIIKGGNSAKARRDDSGFR